MRIRALGATALVALCASGAAQAKGPDLVRACGASRCTTVRGLAAVDRLVRWIGATFTVAETPQPAPFYRITFSDRGKTFMTLLYVPSRHRMRVLQPLPYPYAPGSNHPYWRSVSPAGAAALGRATAGLRPFPAPSAWR
jgi:hypothetical protein